MAAEVAQYLQNKFLTSLEEAESELSGSVDLLSYFEAIKDILEEKDEISSSQMVPIGAVEPSPLLYHLSQLNYALVECRNVANKLKELNKKLLLFNKPFMVCFILRMKKRLTTLKENFRKHYIHVKPLRVRRWEWERMREGVRERMSEWGREREREREREWEWARERARVRAREWERKSEREREWWEREREWWEWKREREEWEREARKREREARKREREEWEREARQRERKMEWEVWERVREDREREARKRERKIEWELWERVREDREREWVREEREEREWVREWEREKEREREWEEWGKWEWARKREWEWEWEWEEWARKREMDWVRKWARDRKWEWEWEWAREREREREREWEWDWEREVLGVHVFGFDEMAKKIDSMLYVSEAGIGFSAIGIVGIAGAGKTTLVRKVLNNTRVWHEYSPIILLGMSNIIKEEYTTVVSIRIVTSMLQRLGCDYDATDEEEGIRLGKLLKTLNQVLRGKKYLIVLDDVWHMNDFYSDLAGDVEDDNNGDRLSHGLPKDSGGAVIVTTTKTRVARGMAGDQNNLILVEQLDRETCWRIFMDSIPNQDLKRSTGETLEKIKNEIQDRSLGLPLAAKMLAEIVPERIRLIQNLGV